MSPAFTISEAEERGLEAALDRDGYAVLPKLLDDSACDLVAAMYDDETAFRSTVVMNRHGYGRGEYRYFARPLPSIVQELRETLYRPLSRIASAWSMRVGVPRDWPQELPALLEICARAGQARPTPLLLRYGPGDYNRLHQDVYGELVFPLQVVILLDEPGRDFTGGEFVLVESRARMQSRASVPPIRRGDALVFPVRDRPVAGRRGSTRATLRHGVGELRSGKRMTLGIIFHDAL
jgi:hypothetical protein